MPSVVETPSLIDDAEFLAELDKLESCPGEAEVDVLSAYWNHAARADDADERRLPALSEPPARTSEPLPPLGARAAKPVRPVRPDKPLRLEKPGRIEMPFQPEAPDRLDKSVQTKRPVRPLHVDEIGEGVLSQVTDEWDVSEGQERRVPAALAALTLVLCLGAGAGSAALVFQDRVAQIVVTWAK